jgi:hypothetical protein
MMGTLRSTEFAGDPRLEACAVSDPAHVVPGSSGNHVAKIQMALIKVGGATINPSELGQQRYGSSTATAVLNFKKQRNILNYLGQFDDIVGKKTIRALDDLLAGTSPPLPPTPPPPPPGPPSVFIVHDVRLFGWKPGGDVLEVNGDTPLQWMIDCAIDRGKANNGNLILKIMSHGLPGFVQCCRGGLMHPTLPAAITDPQKGNMYIGPGKSGISIGDLKLLSQLNGYLKRIEFHCCLVARIGPCFEANGHQCYDGNAFCFQLAQSTGAEVKASIHLQWYWKGQGPNYGMHFGKWNGLVFTWGPAGNIISSESHPYDDKGDGPPPPGTPPT